MKSALPTAPLDDQSIGDQPGDTGLRRFDFVPENPAVTIGVERYAPGKIEHADVEGTAQCSIISRVELQIAGTGFMRIGLGRDEDAEHAQRREHVNEPTGTALTGTAPTDTARHDERTDRNS